jgi:hypothetical protein
MRTTIDLPDPVFRRLKAAAALNGISLKEIILRAVEKELHAKRPRKSRVRFPLIRSKQPGTLLLTNAEIDEILLG